VGIRPITKLDKAPQISREMVRRFEGFVDSADNVRIGAETILGGIPSTLVCGRNFRIAGDPTTMDAMWSHSPKCRLPVKVDNSTLGRYR
jgi:hypothetical protein